MLPISLILIRNASIDKEITELNNQVKVQIVEWSKNRKSQFVKFKYGNQNISKRTSTDFYRKFRDKKEVTMLTNREKDRFIFPGEFEQENGYLYGTILVLVSLFIVYKGIKIHREKR